MAYLGNVPAEAYSSVVKDTFSGDNSTVDFTLVRPATTNGLRVVVNDTLQEPSVDYTCTGTTLTFTSAPATGTDNIYVVHLDAAVQTIAPPAQIDLATTFTNGITVQGNIAVTGTVDGRDVATDGTKLDGIESGATADQTASEILTAIKTVDGAGSGLDADTVDGIQASSFLQDITSESISSLSDVYSSMSPSDGQVLTYDTTNGWQAETISTTLDGLSDTTITSNTSGEILKWNGSAWVNNTLAEAGIQPAGSYLTGNQTITLSGDVSGSGTTAITVTVADDSHNHIISNVDGLQTALDAKLPLAGGTMTGNIVMSGAQTVDGRDLSADGAKLDGIESGATADQTASEILTAIKTVDGAGSGLDADLLDGISSASFFRSDAADSAIGFSSSASVNGSGDSGISINNGGRLGFDQTGTRSWTVKATGGNLAFDAGDGNGNLTKNGNTVWHSGNDGAGSGLDADLLDGISSASFLRSDADDTATGVITLSGGLIVDGTIDSGGDDYAGYRSDGTNIVLKGDASGRSAIFFQSEKNGTNINHPSDYGYIQFHPHNIDGSSGESNKLVIGVANDSDDTVVLQAPYNNGVKISYKNATSGTGGTEYTVWHAGNDGSGSGLDADTVDGVQGTALINWYSRGETSTTTNRAVTSSWVTHLSLGSVVLPSGYDGILFVTVNMANNNEDGNGWYQYRVQTSGAATLTSQVHDGGWGYHNNFNPRSTKTFGFTLTTAGTYTLNLQVQLLNGSVNLNQYNGTDYLSYELFTRKT